MIVMTTSTSISVKPRPRRRGHGRVEEVLMERSRDGEGGGVPAYRRSGRTASPLSGQRLTTRPNAEMLRYLTPVSGGWSPTDSSYGPFGDHGPEGGRARRRAAPTCGGRPVARPVTSPSRPPRRSAPAAGPAGRRPAG